MLLFNIAGHHFVFIYCIDRSDEQVAQLLDNDQYSDDELVELKVALHLPYMSNSQYERIDGEIEIDGKHYNYVKRKIANDTLFVMCLPNTTKTRLFETRNLYNGQVADMNGKENKPSTMKSLPLNEYNQSFVDCTISVCFQPAKKIDYSLATALLHPFPDSCFKPPDGSRA